MSLALESFALSRQEERVVALSMEGLGDKEIAHAMDLSIGTVRTYWKRIQSKVGGQTRAEIIALVSRRDHEEEVRALHAEIDAQRAAEETFRAMCQCAPLGVFIDDGKGCLTFVNAAWERICGRSSEDALGYRYLEMFVPEDHARIRQRWEARVAGEAVPPIEFRAIRQDGRTVWLRSHVSPLIVKGRHLGFVGTIEDVTDRYTPSNPAA